MGRGNLGLLFLVAFEAFVVFVISAGIIEVRLSDSCVAIDALLAFLFSHFGSSDRKRREKQCYSPKYCQRS